MAAIHSAHTNPLMSYTATCKLDDEKQLLLTVKSLSLLLMENLKYR